MCVLSYAFTDVQEDVGLKEDKMGREQEGRSRTNHRAERSLLWNEAIDKGRKERSVEINK